MQALAEGDRLMGLGRYDDAVDSYSEAIELRDDYAAAYRARGFAYDQAGGTGSGSYVSPSSTRRSARSRSRTWTRPSS